MNVNIFGMGYVGCVSAACLAQNGHTVTGIDIDETKVRILNDGKSPIIEPGLNDLIRTAVSNGKLKATLDKIPPADVFMVCVGTPSNENGSLNLTYLKKVVQQIGEFLRDFNHYTVVNVRSTVLPGTIDETVIPILENASNKRAGKDFGVCMNPEFLREGSALEDYHDPPFTMIGELDARSGEIVAQLYENVDAEIIRSEVRVAEMVKYSCNAFHAVKVTFANEVGNICKKFGIDSHAVMEIFCKDDRLNLSPYYLKPGFSFGGSCLPKDLRALLHTAKTVDLDTPLLSSVLPSNEHQIDVAFKMIRKTRKKRIGILGLSFKAGTDDLRESPMVELIEKLIGKGYSLHIYDKEVSMARIFGSNKRYIESAIPHISSLMRETPEAVIKESDVIVFGNKFADHEALLSQVNGEKHVIDLVKVSSDKASLNGQYEGICW